MIIKISSPLGLPLLHMEQGKDAAISQKNRSNECKEAPWLLRKLTIGKNFSDAAPTETITLFLSNR